LGRDKNSRSQTRRHSRPTKATRSPQETNRRKDNLVSAKLSKGKTTVSRVRDANPARIATVPGKPASRALSPKGSAQPKPHRSPLPSPLPLKHVAGPRPVPSLPARSMPPTAKEEPRRSAIVIPIRPPMSQPDFNEAGMLLAITYSIREGRREEFFQLLRELKPLLGGIGGTDCTVYEDRSRQNYLMEVFRFKDEAELTAFDDKFHKDRKIAAIYTLLHDIVEAEKSDFKIFERRL
jgi:hypothetical protein